MFGDIRFGPSRHLQASAVPRMHRDVLTAALPKVAMTPKAKHTAYRGPLRHFGGDARDLRAWLVRRLEQSGHLDDAGRQALLALPLQTRVVAARTDLVDGNAPRGTHLIQSGVACRYEIQANGARRIVALFLSGDLCTLNSALPVDLPGTIGTLSTCTVADIPAHVLQSLSRAHPSIERSLAWMTLLELGIAQRWLVNAGRDAERQVAYFLCEIHTRAHAVDQEVDDLFATGIRQGTIADIAGMSLVHVNRVLHALQRADLITLVKGIVGIPDLDRLAAFASFDPSYLHLPERQSEGLPEVHGDVRAQPSERRPGSACL